MLVRACQRVLGDPHEAEDVAQEAFLVAFRSLVDLARRRPVRRVAGADRGSAGVAPSGAAVAPRRGVDRPGRSRSWSGAPRDRAGSAAGLARLALERRSVADPAAVAVRADDAAAVRSAVARLDEPYREIVALRFFGELSLGEIAVEADRPLATVKTQLRRGLLRLRQVLGEDRR